jgi:hypothetical protein
MERLIASMKLNIVVSDGISSVLNIEVWLGCIAGLYFWFRQRAIAASLQDSLGSRNRFIVNSILTDCNKRQFSISV